MAKAFQDALFDRRRQLEHTLANGTCLKLVLEPLGEGRVRVLEYYRRPRNAERFKRSPQDEREYLYRQLGLPLSYEALFGPD